MRARSNRPWWRRGYPGVWITSPGSLIGALPVTIAQGGTGQTTAAAALTALGGAATGSHTLKRGTAAANYTSTAASFAAIDATNLNIALVVPTGSIAIATFIGGFETSSGKTSRIGISVDGTVTFYESQSGGLASFVPFCAKAVLVGDGSSHTFSPVFWVDSGGTVTVINLNESLTGAAATSFTPLHLVEVYSAS